MGAVDLVIQVESPPSVASGLQRVGRAGHNVGDVSRGVIFPKYAADLIQASVVAERMHARVIEELRIPRNPLDVLAQQIVAMTALDDWSVDELEAVVRRSAPFSGLTRSVLEAVLDMLAGRYPGEEFAGLKPQDRVGPGGRGDPRPAGSAEAGRDQRRHDPRPGLLRGVPRVGRGVRPGRRRRGAAGPPRCGAPAPGSRSGSASSTRRWCTSRGSATCSCSAPRPGGSRTSRRTGCWCCPRPASRASCRSGTATRPGGPPSSARRSAPGFASSPR